MSKNSSGHCTLLTLLFVVVQTALVTENLTAGEPVKTSAMGAATGGKKAVVYRPPRRGTPSTRVGGGSRGTDASAPSLFVLTPEDTGLTLQAQPTLYWFVSRPVDAQMEFTLITENDLQTVVEKRMSDLVSEGIHGASLKALGVELKAGASYQWSVAIVTDQGNRSSDVFASGTIERVAKSEVLPAVQAGSSRNLGVSNYAEAGLWYDALEAAARLIENHPDQKHSLEQRASLLEQVGLIEAAAYDRKSVR